MRRELKRYIVRAFVVFANIRQCALKKGVMTCGGCPDIETCQDVGAVISNNPDALKNLKG